MATATDIWGTIPGPPVTGTPHLLVPFAIGDTGSAATVEQGTVAEITQCVAMLLGTRPGTRLMVPGFGLPDPTFAGVNPTAVRALAAKYEPRATVSVTETPSSPEAVTVSVGTASPVAS
jgi:hypothetical protein